MVRDGRLTLMIAAWGTVAVLGACGSPDSGASPEADAGKFAIVTGASSWDGHDARVNLQVTNEGGALAKDVVVDCSFFDAGGAFLGSNKGFVPVLEPGESRGTYVDLIGHKPRTLKCRGRSGWGTGS